ncbi:RNA polymerase sigma factor SigB [Brevibacillus sp. SYP-B805]|uniref:RNA polymerase sigma factor SigB n=1 Tax=Brevibacillus sp. SYP-B805 TaxID=1578199 RepID=UPI0013EA5DAE|nr:RNA polymerase sigma factor SigB [Brevibacillus sp. SYP-B805]NGQ96053.1 RNA polymerase sigma factor SigB [Brevibacillus sp. SYP-B805]
MADQSPSKRTREEAARMIAAYRQAPTEELQNALVLHFRPLVESIAARFARGQEPLEDLIQVGMIGLLGALRRYDTSFGRTFESFAIPTIVGEIKRHIRDKTWSVHVPRRIKELSPKIKKAVDELTVRLQRSPQIADIARHLSVSEEEVLETMEMGRNYHTLSVDNEIEADSDGSTITLLDLIGSEDRGYDHVEQEMTLAKILHVLNDREKEIIQLIFYDNLSQKQAGDQLGISQMHVSRLQRRALAKLREAMEQQETLKRRKTAGE